jgi:hypothetical protein
VRPGVLVGVVAVLVVAFVLLYRAGMLGNVAVP